MKKRSSIWRAIIASGLAIIMSFASVLGTTFAWFTDTASSSSNIIQSGELDVEMYWSETLLDANSTAWKNAYNVPIFTYDNWEPGYTDVKYVKVKNAGNLAFKWKLSIEAEGEVTDLADVIDVYYVNPASAALTSLAGKTSAGLLSKVLDEHISTEGVLLPSSTTSGSYASGEVILAIALHMHEDAENTYQGMSIGDGFAVKVVATQFDFENDAFGNDYDQGSTWPDNIPVGGSSASTNITTNAEGRVETQAFMQSQDGISSATIPAGVKVESGVNALQLVIKDVADSEANITLSENEASFSIDVHVNGVAEDNDVPMAIYRKELLPTSLNMGNYRFYHVEDGRTVEMTLLADGDTPVHNSYEYDPATGDVILHLATFSEVALVAAPPVWEGNYATSFAGGSGTEADPYLIANADQFAYFGDLISNDNVNYGSAHYKLIADIDLGGGEHNFYPIGYHKVGGEIATLADDDAPVFIYHEEDPDYARSNGASAVAEGEAAVWYTYGGAFKGTFDGNGNKISNIYQNTWQLKGNYDGNYWNAAMGIFGYVNGGTIKNLTVDNFSSDGEFTPTGVIAAYAAGDAKFINIAITKCNPRVYNTGNGGIIGIAGDTRAANDDHITLTNITVDNSNKISALWGSYDVACGGLVGMYRGNVDGNGNATGDTIEFNNCHVSAQIDVYNDVCANYQYYAYRYSGMIIGSVRHNTTIDGKTVPNMTGISAESCTVHFGTWNDYYYCEIIDNTTASYTHDYQMSRLTEIKAIEGTTITYLDGTTGTVPASGRANYVIVDYTKGHGSENATCYHFRNGEVWTHDMGGIQTGIDENGDGQDDLKEDKQHLYLEFNNLFTGYGWGVSSMAINKWNGITALDVEEGDHEESVNKFNPVDNLDTNIATESTLTIGEIFAAIENAGVAIKSDNVQVAVSPFGATSTAGGKYIANTTDWTLGTLTFSGMGQAVITITDYYFCNTTSITVNIIGAEKFNTKFENYEEYLYRVGNADKSTVALGTIFKHTGKGTIDNASVDVTFDTVSGNATGIYTQNASDWTKGTIQFNGTGIVKVTIKDATSKDFTLCLEVIDAVNATAATSATSNNVVLLNDIGSGFTVSGRYTVYGNGFTLNYTGNGQYLNNGLKQGVVTVSENGTLDNLRIVAPVYPAAYMYYGYSAIGDYVQGGPSSVEGDRTRYHYQLSAVAISGNATISNCYIYGGRNNVFVNTGDVTIKDTILECGTVANVQIQSNSSHTITLEDVTTIQYRVNATIVDTTKVMLGAGVLVGPETTDNPTIVLNGDFKQYNWVTADDKNDVPQAAQMIIDGALNATQYNHTVSGKTASNLGIIYMNEVAANIVNNTGLPYYLGTVKMTASNVSVSGKAYSLQGATEGQIYSDYENADRTTVNGLYAPQFKYDSTLGGQYVAEGGDEHFYREGDTIKVMFVSGDTKELDLAKLINIEKYAGQNLNLAITCKDENENAVEVTDGKITLSAAGTYTVTYTVTDTVFYDKDGKTITHSETYRWDVTVEVSLKDTAVPDARFEFDSTKQKMGYYKPTLGDVKQYLPFLAGLKIYDYNGKTEYVRFNGDTDYNKIASVTITGYTSNEAYIEVKLTDGGVINTKFLARADSGGGSTYTGKIQTSNNTVYFVSDSGTSNKDTTTTAAYWYVDFYKFTGNNGVAIQSAQQTFNSTGSSASTPSGSFSTTIKYTVSYDANGGNCGQTVGYATSAAEAVTLPTPTRSGCTFLGWYTATSGGTRVGGAGDSYRPSANVTLYAQWAKHGSIVTYNANGGSCGTASEKYSGTSLILPTATRDGYWFIGWYDAATGGNKIGDAGSVYNPVGNITLYAHWQEQIKYTVTYDANGGTCGTTSATYEGTALTLPTPNTRTGYTFNGWYTAASGGTKEGDAGATYTPSANVTLYAQWQVNSYTIKVTTSNATVKVNGTTVANNGTVSIPYGTSVTVEVTYSKNNSKTTTITGTDGNTYTSPFNMPAQNVTIDASSKDACVTGDTLVTLADGTQKRIDQVTTDDMLLVWNFFTGEYDVVPAAIIFYHGDAEYDVLKLHFEDGTTVKVINTHGFYDVELDEFVFIDIDNVEEYIGHKFAKVDGDDCTSVALVGYEEVKEYTGNYSIQTAMHINFIVEGMFSLTIPPFEGWFDYFEIGDGMKYDEAKMQADIEKYGLYTYEEFAEYVTYEQFIAFNGPYLKVLVGRGVVTYEQIIELISMYVNP